MASYTFNTTPQQESLLSWVVQQSNLQRDIALTNSEFVQVRFAELLAPFADDYKQHLLLVVAKALASADAATQQQVLQLLKVSP